MKENEERQTELADQDGETRGAEAANQDGGAELSTPADSKRPGLVGVRSTANGIIAWNLLDGLNVVVTARPIIKERAWSLECRSAGEVKLIATIMGGRMTAQAMARKVVDGMTSRAKTLKKNHARRLRRAEPANQDVVRQAELASQDGKEA